MCIKVYSGMYILCAQSLVGIHIDVIIHSCCNWTTAIILCLVQEDM